MKIVVFFSGTGTNLNSIIQGQSVYKYEVVSCFTNNPEASGIKFCQEANIACHIIDHQLYKEREAFDFEINEYLNAMNFDYIILAGYMRILSKKFVAEWEGQIINIHPSLLPKYPGLDTHKRVLESGDKIHGTTIHYVTEELDAGPIIRQESFKIEPSDSEESLISKVKEIENNIYPETISKLIT